MKVDIPFKTKKLCGNMKKVINEVRPLIDMHICTLTHANRTIQHTYMIFFFIIQCVKARAIPCPHQPPTRVDNTVSVAQGGTATPGATNQLLPPDRVLRE